MSFLTKVSFVGPVSLGGRRRSIQDHAHHRDLMRACAPNARHWPVRTLPWFCHQPEGNTIPSTTTAVSGGVDTHAATHHAAAVDSQGRFSATLSFQPAIAATPICWAGSAATGPRQSIDVEGAGAYGAGLVRLLGANDVAVSEIP